jgi:hypothetical protein
VEHLGTHASCVRFADILVGDFHFVIDIGTNLKIRSSSFAGVPRPSRFEVEK